MTKIKIKYLKNKKKKSIYQVPPLVDEKSFLKD
jgi:hypothetical protein